jgi:hypothetical protein
MARRAREPRPPACVGTVQRSAVPGEIDFYGRPVGCRHLPSCPAAARVLRSVRALIAQAGRHGAMGHGVAARAAL